MAELGARDVRGPTKELSVSINDTTKGWVGVGCVMHRVNRSR